MLLVSTASACSGVSSRRAVSASAKAVTAFGAAGVSSGRNCIARCMAVPRSAPVSPRFSCKNRGFSGAAVRRAGSVPSAIS